MDARRGYRSGVRALAVFACAWAIAACDESLEGVLVAPTEGPPQLQAVTSQNLLAQIGVQLLTPIRVRVLDARDRPIQSATVKYAVMAGGGVFSADSTLTNDQGFTQVLFLPLTSGMVIVEARVERPGGNDRLEFAILVLNDPDEVEILEPVSGDNQMGTIGTILRDPLVVRVRNPDGFPVSGVPVTFTLHRTEGDSAGVTDSKEGFFGPTFQGQVTVNTDGSGTARAFVRLGTRPGVHTVTAHALTGPVGNQVTQSVTFFATATPSAQASQLIAISGMNQTAVIDTINLLGTPEYQGRDPNPLVVQALDRFGNPMQNVAVQWRISDGGGFMFNFATATGPGGFSQNIIRNVTEGRNAVVAVAEGTNTVEFVITGTVYVPPADPDDGDGDGGDGGGGGGG